MLGFYHGGQTTKKLALVEWVPLFTIPVMRSLYFNNSIFMPCHWREEGNEG